MDAAGLRDEGYYFEKVRKKCETNDPNPEQFWSILKEVEKICKVKADHHLHGALTVSRMKWDLRWGGQRSGSIYQISYLTSIRAACFSGVQRLISNIGESCQKRSW